MSPRRVIFIAALLLIQHLVLAQPSRERAGLNEPAVAGRTPDGRPDLQGIWSYQTATPLQRPP